MIRSALFVPGDRLDLVTKLRGRDAAERPDRIIVDLEDAVAPGAKPAARNAVVQAFASGLLDDDVVVRVNTGDDGRADIRAIHGVANPLIFVPKANAPSITAAGDAVAASGGVPRLWALIETAAGLRDVEAIASASMVEQLAIGEADLCAELGVRPAADHALWPLRMMLVVAASLAGMDPPLGPISADFADLERYERVSIDVRDGGFGGRLAIHPRQVSVLHRVFTPSPSDIAQARRVVELYDAATTAQQGAVVGDDGTMIDEAIVRSARRLLESVRPEEIR